MYPFLKLGPIELPTYGTIIFIGLIIGIIFIVINSKIYNISKTDVVLSSILASVGMIVGAKLLFMITVIPDIVKEFYWVKTHIPGTISYLFGGYVFYGGFIGALLCTKFYCKRMDINFLKYTNILVPAIPFMHSIGRIGCFFGGCCYGIEYHGFCSIQYPNNGLITTLSAVPRFPVQLLEALINMILFFILMIYGRKVRKNGIILGIYLISYSIIRFSLEFLRGDVERGIVLGVSTSQWISLLLLPLGLWLILRKDKEKS